jgi:hypothetical protein
MIQRLYEDYGGATFINIYEEWMSNICSDSDVASTPDLDVCRGTTLAAQRLVVLHASVVDWWWYGEARSRKNIKGKGAWVGRQV